MTNIIKYAIVDSICRCNCHYVSFTNNCSCNCMRRADKPILKSEWQLMQERVNQLEAENKKLKAANKEMEEEIKIRRTLNLHQNGQIFELIEENQHLKAQLQTHKEIVETYQENSETLKTELSNLLSCDKDSKSIYNVVAKLKAQSQQEEGNVNYEKEISIDEMLNHLTNRVALLERRLDNLNEKQAQREPLRDICTC